LGPRLKMAGGIGEGVLGEKLLLHGDVPPHRAISRRVKNGGRAGKSLGGGKTYPNVGRLDRGKTFAQFEDSRPGWVVSSGEVSRSLPVREGRRRPHVGSRERQNHNKTASSSRVPHHAAERTNKLKSGDKFQVNSARTVVPGSRKPIFASGEPDRAPEAAENTLGKAVRGSSIYSMQTEQRKIARGRESKKSATMWKEVGPPNLFGKKNERVALSLGEKVCSERTSLLRNASTSQTRGRE